MSLILEALRKSEAQRRRAQAPDLFAEPATVTRQVARSAPRWLGWALAAVAAVLLAGWFARGPWKAPLPRASMQAAPVPADVAPPAPATGGIRLPPATVAGTSPRAGIAVASTPNTAAAGGPAAPSLPTVSAPARALPEPPPGAASAASANAPRPPATGTAATPVATAVMPATAVTVATAPPAQPAYAGDTLLRLADLSPGERLQLPALKMSMHLWDTASAQRFVIIDGQRLGEGDRLGDAVIEQITADGVLLAWHGHRLTLPMR